MPCITATLQSVLPDPQGLATTGMRGPHQVKVPLPYQAGHAKHGTDHKLAAGRGLIHLVPPDVQCTGASTGIALLEAATQAAALNDPTACRHMHVGLCLPIYLSPAPETALQAHSHTVLVGPSTVCCQASCDGLSSGPYSLPLLPALQRAALTAGATRRHAWQQG